MAINDVNFTLKNNKIQKSKASLYYPVIHRISTNKVMEIFIHSIKSLKYHIFYSPSNNAILVGKFTLKPITLQYKFFCIFIF
jgi:hypothetical protein